MSRPSAAQSGRDTHATSTHRQQVLRTLRRVWGGKKKKAFARTYEGDDALAWTVVGIPRPRGHPAGSQPASGDERRAPAPARTCRGGAAAPTSGVAPDARADVGTLTLADVGTLARADVGTLARAGGALGTPVKAPFRAVCRDPGIRVRGHGADFP